LDLQIQCNLRIHLTKKITAVLIDFKTAFEPRTEEQSTKCAVKVKVQAKVKVKFDLEQATKAQRGSRGRYTLSLTSALGVVGG